MKLVTTICEYFIRKKRTYNLTAYVVYSLCISLILAVIYKEIFLNNILFFTISDSLWLARSIFFQGFLFHLLFTIDDCKTNASFINLIIPFELVVAITYFTELKIAVLISAGAFFIFSILFTILLTVRRIENSDKFKTIMYRLKASAFVSKFIFILCFIPIVILAFVTAVIEPAIEKYEFNRYQESDYYASLSIGEHHQALDSLGKHEDEEKWQALDTSTKTDLLQIILDMDAKRLGLPYRVRLEIADEPDTKLGGVYDDTEKTITIYNISNKTGIECLYILFHELFHSAQHCYVEVYNRHIPDKYKNLYFFNDAWFYNENFSKYVSSECNIFEYMLQEAEMDADTYSEDSVLFYTTEIFRYNNGYATKGE